MRVVTGSFTPHARNMATLFSFFFKLDQLTSSNRDPTLAVTSSIPVPCAAVSFPAMALPRRWVWDVHGGDRRWKNVGNGEGGREGRGGC